MQNTFKKDSRVWLHKSSKRKSSGNESANFINAPKSSPNEDDLDDTPYITGVDGKMYKKDSRTWLHKSSVANIVKTGRSVSLVTSTKNQRRMWDTMNRTVRDKSKIDSPMAQDSNELIRANYRIKNVGKRKKNSPKGRAAVMSLSHRNLRMITENDEAASDAYGYDKRPRVRYVKGSYSDQDNTNDESSSESDGSLDDEDQNELQQTVIQRLCECPLTHNRHAVLNCNSNDGVTLCRSNASIELTQDGLNVVREIAKEMEFHHVRRYSYFMDYPDQSMLSEDCRIHRRYTSCDGLNSSKSSPNVCSVNLSEECVSEQCGIPLAESDYQLSQAAQGLNVQSPLNIQYRYHTEHDD